jgi:DNA-binding response OmpR family regulator
MEMAFNVLIVEDQPIIAMGLEDAVEALGHHSIGVARNRAEATLLSATADMALVDVNLDDGPTGPGIGRDLAIADITVLFMTSDPGALGDGVKGTLGVMEKPILDLEVVKAIQYAADTRSGVEGTCPPNRLRTFPVAKQ